MKTFLLSLACFFAVSSYGQSNMLEKDSVPVKKVMESNNKQISAEMQHNNVIHIGISVLPTYSLPNDQTLHPIVDSNRRHYDTTLSDSVNAAGAQLQFQHSRTLFVLNETTLLVANKDYDNYIYEGITTVGGSFIWHPIEKLMLNGTVSISRYFYGPTQLMSAVTPSSNVYLRYQLLNWLALKTFGEFSANGNKIPSYSLLVPQNAFGVGVVMKITKSIGVEAGVEEVNYGGKWHRGFYANPSDY